jgi:IclR helix-turn-helix domain
LRRFHKGSVFGTGPRVALCREQRAQWRARLLLARRPGGLTIGAQAVGLALLRLLGEGGQLDPEVATIADLARVSRSTALRALAQLKALGFLTWARRLVRSGWRVEQTSNAYVLAVPSESHFGTEVRVIDKDRKARGLTRVSPGDRSDWESQRAERDRQLVLLGFAPMNP